MKRIALLLAFVIGGSTLAFSKEVSDNPKLPESPKTEVKQIEKPRSTCFADRLFSTQCCDGEIQYTGIISIEFECETGIVRGVTIVPPGLCDYECA
ncbi:MULTISPECIES: hypothetical protein [Niastella]|uniref:Uncharacterized protein n=1 Tax=Niastella soli TaxID=2821487 RepID=A0ABS3YYR9_9BACT|nr:hypothetical protein [Niastella soli]MBO9203063.1 hypothetical protein [Niastella soli]